MNYDKLTSKEFIDKLDRQIVEEKYSEIPYDLIQIVKNNSINYCLSKKKGIKGKPTARVLNNWIRLGIVQINDSDKGKIKRFDVLESIWLNILVELREFGISIESIKRTRKTLFDNINEFSLFKFHIINSIIREQQTLIVFKDGEAKILSTDFYLHLLHKNKFQHHLSFKLIDFIEPEFPNNAIDKKFDISNVFENTQKIKLLFFLKSGNYQNIKVKLSEQDIRYIENGEMLINNVDVVDSISKWNFEEITISIDDKTGTIITPNN